MGNTIITPTIFAREALMILENECVAGKLVYRDYEGEFNKNPNGYEVGNTISIRRPTDFTVRDGRTASIQDVVEGSFPFVVNSFKGVDFAFTSQELTQNINEIRERVIRPAMIQLANKIDADVFGLYTKFSNWVGGNTTTAIDAYSEFTKGTERLDLNAVPDDPRAAVLSPTDAWAMLGSQTALYMQDVAKGAYRNAELGQIADMNTYRSRNLSVHTRGTATTATAHANTHTYANTLTANTATLGLTFLTSQSIEAGAVFSITGIKAVNPVTKATLPYDKQFVVTAAAGGTGTVTVTITPPIITAGAFQNTVAGLTSGTGVTFVGNATGTYAQNLFFHKNAMGLAVVPLAMPAGLPNGATRQSYKGYSVRIIPYYSGSNDIASWRLDVLYGANMVDERLGVRINGTA